MGKRKDTYRDSDVGAVSHSRLKGADALGVASLYMLDEHL